MIKILAASLLMPANLAFAVDAAATVIATAGANPAAITSAVTVFQEMLGPLNAPGTGGNPAGRREINWDAVPANFAAPNNLPPDFFNRNSIRGAVFTAENPGCSGFQVSANAADGPARFDTLAPGYSSLFQVFSTEKLFTSIGSTDYFVEFFVPGTQ